MSRFNKLFSDAPPGEPAWMREFARGGDPTAHRQDESWPAAGVAAYNAGRGKSVNSNLRASSGKVGAGPVRASTGGAGASVVRRRSPKTGKSGGGCSCGGDGKCKSERGGGSQASRALGSAHSASSTPSRRTSTVPTVAELTELVLAGLRTGGNQMTAAQVTDIVSVHP